MENETINPKQSYRIDQVATILGVERRTVYRRINDTESPLPAFRTGRNGHIRVLGADLQRYIDANRIDPLNE